MSEIQYQLPNETELEQYRIQKTLSSGGFSIVYLAVDQSNGQQVVIKEYLPQRAAMRDTQFNVVPQNDEFTDYINEGRKLFFQEASSLATLKHPNIVNVLSFFNANQTVYMVMEYRPGKNLQSYIHSHPGRLSETFMRTVFPPLMEGLSMVHKAGLLHLDIKPSNIHLLPGGHPILLDFGAVHRMQISRQMQPRPVVTAGFSPIEQYNTKGYIGPWTDIYALGATMWTCISKKSPPKASQRQENECLKPVAIEYRRHYTLPLLEAIDWALEMDPVLRPQNINEFLAHMNNIELSEPVNLFEKWVNHMPWLQKKSADQ